VLSAINESVVASNFATLVSVDDDEEDNLSMAMDEFDNAE